MVILIVFSNLKKVLDYFDHRWIGIATELAAKTVSIDHPYRSNVVGLRPNE
jgi:hypothetical protein